MTDDQHAAIPGHLREDVETLWSYHRINDALRTVDVAVGLGSHDPGVAEYTAELYHQGYFPLIAFTGANAPTTVERFPRGEAVHYREIAIQHGVPDAAILVEPHARNTGENIEYTRALLANNGITARSLLLISRPYQQRRAYATAKKAWPEVEILCTAQHQPLEAYTTSIGDADKVINMLVGDTQRITAYAERGFAIPQDVPDSVNDAYQRLVSAGFTKRLL